jgi:tetratricopeptide (TPR) repeat protein
MPVACRLSSNTDLWSDRVLCSLSAEIAYNHGILLNATDHGMTPDPMDLPSVQHLIDSSRTPRRRLRGSTLVLLGLSVLLGALVADNHLLADSAWGWLLPQALILILAAILFQKSRQQRESARMMEKALEAVQLRQWPDARSSLEAVLGRPMRSPSGRAESLLALAAVAEAQGSYEASQIIYESLLSEQAGDPLQLHTARVALAGVFLRNGQVTDAVSLIERLERANLPDSLKAQVELLALFREVTMGHAESGVPKAAQRRRLFRDHLSTRAGYGYGLLAAAHDRAGDDEAARACWHDATLLVPQALLVARYRELAPVSAKYPAVENPL